jgi:uncharacterized protein (UPF0216 family)
MYYFLNNLSTKKSYLLVMESNKINENTVLGILRNILSEEVSKVNRNDYNRVQFKMDELEGQLSETIKELRRLQDSIPDGLKTVTNGRVKIISDSLSTAHTTLKVLKDKVRTHKKSLNQNQTEDKKIK